MSQFQELCILRKTLLPLLPCDESRCDWYIRDSACNNCFWILSELFAEGYLDELSFEEIAQMEGITVDEAMEIFNTAIEKCRFLCRKELITKDSNDI